MLVVLHHPRVDGVDGVVCGAGDVAGFAAAVRRLIENPAERERLRAAGLARAKEYEWDAVHSRMVQNYQHVLAGGRA